MGRCYGAAGDSAAEQALLPLCNEADPEIVIANLVLMMDQDLDAAQVGLVEPSSVLQNTATPILGVLKHRAARKQLGMHVCLP